MILAHKTVSSMPDLFSLLGTYDLKFHFKNTRHADVFLWRYEGELLEGKSDIPVIIPTADIKIKQDEI